MRGYFRTFIDSITPDTTDESGDQSAPSTLIVPEEVCEETVRGLQSHSSPGNDHEGITYWAGITHEALNAKIILAVIVPGATTSPGSYDVSLVANAAVVEAIHEHDLELIATVHSYPGSMTSHSGRDDEEAQLPHEGYYSVVVPNYAYGGVRPFTDCGVHIYQHSQFKELDAETIESTICSIPSPPTHIDTRN
jgi:hypothetical protein